MILHNHQKFGKNFIHVLDLRFMLKILQDAYIWPSYEFLKVYSLHVLLLWFAAV